MSENLVGWIIFGAVFTPVNSVTSGLGLLLLMPNAIRARPRKAVAVNAAPESRRPVPVRTPSPTMPSPCLDKAWPTSSPLLCGIVTLATALIFLFALFIVTEGTYDGVGSLKVSLEHGKQSIAGNLIQMLLVGGSLALFTLVTCFLGGLIAMPLALVAFEHFYQGSVPTCSPLRTAQIPAKG